LGIGWSITSALCLAAMPSLVDQLRVEPLTRGRFSRRVQVVGRTNELGNLAEHTAQMAREVMMVECMVPLMQQLPWV
ncbi:hypothetical protein, partial [Salmonella enterica]|uniref:hypothetical protein n=1 Tax=Salmonella enterica TaxID=28901 RepID=UPI003D274002